MLIQFIKLCTNVKTFFYHVVNKLNLLLHNMYRTIRLVLKAVSLLNQNMFTWRFTDRVLPMKEYCILINHIPHKTYISTKGQ